LYFLQTQSQNFTDKGRNLINVLGIALGNILFHIIYLKDVSSAEEAQHIFFVVGKIKPFHVVFIKLYVRTHAVVLFQYVADIFTINSLISNLMKFLNKDTIRELL
jgi:hypothetical protein